MPSNESRTTLGQAPSDPRTAEAVRWSETVEPREIAEASYGASEPAPLAGYAALAGIWTAGLGAFLIAARDRLPRHVAAGDFVLLALATHKLSRVIAKDRVTSPLRAPFVRLQESGGEIVEKPRGRGLRRVAGELVTSRASLVPWLAAALGAGFVLAPRATRFLATVLGAAAVVDVANAAAKRLTRP